MVRVFINGFGRIGRTMLRAQTSGAWPEVEVVGINDIAAADLCAHLFAYDSVFGPFPGTVHFSRRQFGRGWPVYPAVAYRRYHAIGSV